MKIRNLIIFMGVYAINFYVLQAAPIVQKIINKSQIGFIIIFHNDVSSCSLDTKNNIVDAKSTFETEFLLVRNNIKQPSVVLRPVYYQDSVTGVKFELLNENNGFDDSKIERAYVTWKSNGHKRIFKNGQDWLQRWVGKDIIIVPDSKEVYGYLNNKSRAHITNFIKGHGQWLSYAKGVFAQLMLEIVIDQHDRRGIFPILKVIAGEGGVCTNGVVEKI